MQNLSEQEIIRRNSLAEIIQLGIDPFPHEEFVVNAKSVQIKAEFENHSNPLETESFKNVRLAGRLMMFRF